LRTFNRSRPRRLYQNLGASFSEVC
jgi:hypothetical protein